MKENNAPKAIRLQDYQPPAFLIDETHLDVKLYDSHTLVTANLRVRANPDNPVSSLPPLQLDGADLELQSLALDGEALSPEQYTIAGETLTVLDVPSEFKLTIVTKINPANNTSLEGLYVSNGMYCTQCEAEGFRKITYYLDRPDVMAVFTTRIEADKSRYPVLLSNGNPVDAGELDNNRHFVTWEDPFKKPCYLFALVAGTLSKVEDEFVTQSGRTIKLQLFVEPQDLDKCDHAMGSLQRSMAWDEQTYGREYDLDIYMIVAVSHFNMGAMENKGLNIFNTSCVLANPATTTDAGFQRVESVIAHEYFHNWSGNRVTCRDWFQLSLKEGFTVFRDQQFSADMGSATVNRIDDVNLLRTVQFAEDSGPMAHPVRPDSYIEINNFYTVTVYEKGAEVVRMLNRLLGPAGFRRGSDLYFDRHDGQAVTCDDFVQAMESANGVDFSQFRRWYSQAGTPRVTASAEYFPTQQEWHLTLSQQTPATPGQAEKQPLVIPVGIGLLAANGEEFALTEKDQGPLAAEDAVISFTQAQQTFVFTGISERPVASLFRGLSAPIKLSFDQSTEDLLFLMRHDSDGFNRWGASQQLILTVLKNLIEADELSASPALEALVKAFKTLLLDQDLDQAMVAKMLELPSEQFLAEWLPKPVPVDAIHESRSWVKRYLAQGLAPELLQVYQACASDEDYVYQMAAVARRSLRNRCLDYLMALGTQAEVDLCVEQYHNSNNMTDRMAAFRALVHSAVPEAEAVIADFYQRWSHEPLVVDQWFSVQATAPAPSTLDRVQSLLQHSAFDIRTPNKVRALVGAFCNGNPVNFHRADGGGYKFLADRIIELNQLNPQVAARMTSLFSRWRDHDEVRGSQVQQQLRRIQQQQLSPDVYEIVEKSLK